MIPLHYGTGRGPAPDKLCNENRAIFNILPDLIPFRFLKQRTITECLFIIRTSNGDIYDRKSSAFVNFGTLALTRRSLTSSPERLHTLSNRSLPNSCLYMTIFKMSEFSAQINRQTRKTRDPGMIAIFWRVNTSKSRAPMIKIVRFPYESYTQNNWVALLFQIR